MRYLRKNFFGLCVMVIGLGIGASAWAVTSGTGPYYATPSWDQTLPAATRFIVLTNMNSDAVLDRETGLVWEQSPSTLLRNFVDTSFHCLTLSKGGRKGWRLPTIQDLASLIDPTQLNPVLPSGHPFNIVQSSLYWSATYLFDGLDSVWLVYFANGFFALDKNSNSNLAWCVRGGPGINNRQ